MSRERGISIVLTWRDALERFYGSCIFRIFGSAAVRERIANKVGQGMNVIGQDSNKNMRPADLRSLECEAAGPGPLVPRGDFMAGLLNYSKALLVPAVLLCFFIFGSASVSFASAPAGAAVSRSAGTGSSDAAKKMKILSVLEGRTRDRMVLDKAVDTLSTMEGSRLRLLSSLSDRISKDPGAGADIAFSLMTVLIVLS
jgi:hypothetical protein